MQKGNNHMGVFNDTLKEYGLGSGEKLKLAEGQNKVRVLSEPRMVQSVYQGQPNTKFVAWVIDRKDGKIKLFYMPKTILEGISALEETEGYAFNSLPMPYDIMVNAKGAGTKEVVYSVFPMPATKLTEAELEEFHAKKPIDEVVARLLENQNVSEVQTDRATSRIKDEDNQPPPPVEPPPATGHKPWPGQPGFTPPGA
jgi:hypothetical protein